MTDTVIEFGEIHDHDVFKRSGHEVFSWSKLIPNDANALNYIKSFLENRIKLAIKFNEQDMDSENNAPTLDFIKRRLTESRAELIAVQSVSSIDDFSSINNIRLVLREVICANQSHQKSHNRPCKA